MIPTLQDGTPRYRPSKLHYKARCLVCKQFVRVDDAWRLVRHAQLGKASRHKCSGSGAEVKARQ